ncbi:MAG: hypothetical protein COA97_09760 [Flavobacteriales bacterium]|nr:MAG: hypothetical protein COA97_09760 [Flavobacteriales bacterium]
MIENWLEYNEKDDAEYVFKLVHITEKESPNDDLIKLLQERILTSYRSADFYNFHFGETVTEEEIREYIQNQVIPNDENQFDRNVRQGDWGEILSGLIASYFQDLIVPINKLQWKFNKDKAVFGTDLLAFNKGDTIEDIYYYEIKTRLNPNNKEGKKPNRNYISIWAHNSLMKDEQSPTESIADFLERLYVEKEDYENASKFKDIVKNPQNYNKKFELFLIVEKDKFIEDILTELDELPPQLDPLSVTIILIDDLRTLVNRTWEDIESVLVDKLINE